MEKVRINTTIAIAWKLIVVLLTWCSIWQNYFVLSFHVIGGIEQDIASLRQTDRTISSSKASERASSSAWTSSRNLFSRSTVPRLKDTDMIDLYHLRSFPVPQVHSQTGRFFIQSSGLALRSSETSELIILEYQPFNFSCSFLPTIITSYESNETTLIWDKRAEVFYYNRLDIDYWQQSTFLARVNGVVYENYIKWVEDYIESHNVFVPHAICSGTDLLSCFSRSRTWETFISDSLDEIAGLAVTMNAIIPPRASDAQLITFMEPEVVCMHQLPGGGVSNSVSLEISARDDNNTGQRTFLPLIHFQIQ